MKISRDLTRKLSFLIVRVRTIKLNGQEESKL